MEDTCIIARLGILRHQDVQEIGLLHCELRDNPSGPFSTSYKRGCGHDKKNVCANKVFLFEGFVNGARHYV